MAYSSERIFNGNLFALIGCSSNKGSFLRYEKWFWIVICVSSRPLKIGKLRKSLYVQSDKVDTLQLGAVQQLLLSCVIPRCSFHNNVEVTPFFTTALPAQFVLCYSPIQRFHLLVNGYESFIWFQSFIWLSDKCYFLSHTLIQSIIAGLDAKLTSVLRYFPHKLIHTWFSFSSGIDIEHALVLSGKKEGFQRSWSHCWFCSFVECSRFYMELFGLRCLTAEKRIETPIALALIIVILEADARSTEVSKTLMENIVPEAAG